MLFCYRMNDPKITKKNLLVGRRVRVDYFIFSFMLMRRQDKEVGIREGILAAMDWAVLYEYINCSLLDQWDRLIPLQTTGLSRGHIRIFDM